MVAQSVALSAEWKVVRRAACWADLRVPRTAQQLVESREVWLAESKGVAMVASMVVMWADTMAVVWADEMAASKVDLKAASMAEQTVECWVVSEAVKWAEWTVALTVVLTEALMVAMLAVKLASQTADRMVALLVGGRVALTAAWKAGL